MRKGSKVIFEGKRYVVWSKEGMHVIIYDPYAKFPETTMISTSVSKCRKD